MIYDAGFNEISNGKRKNKKMKEEEEEEEEGREKERNDGPGRLACASFAYDWGH